MQRLPTRTLMFLGAMYAALSLGAAAAQADASTPLRKVPLSTLTDSKGGTLDSAVKPFRWAVSANPGVLDGRANADQILLQAARRHRCQSLHVDFVAGGQAQSAALVLRRAGLPDKVVETQTDTPGTLDAALRPGRAWSLAASTPSVSLAVYANGSVSCRGAKGLS